MGKIGVVILTIITCLFGEVHSSFAKEYYVSKIGKDASTCISSPGPDSYACKTIMYVVNNTALVGGDIVYIQAGTYDEHIVLTNADDGAAPNYVTFRSYQNDNVTITNSAYNDEVMLIFTSDAVTQYIKWDGRGNDNGYHITFDANHSRENAVQLEYCDHIWFTGINFTQAYNRNGLKLLSKTQENLGGPSTEDGTKNCLIEYCKFYDNGDYGIKLTGYGTNNNTIRYCDIYNNGILHYGTNYYGMNLSGSGYEANQPNGNIIHHCNFYSNYDSGLNIQHCRNTQIYNCAFYGNGTGTNTARGISVGPDANSSIIYNNAIYNNSYYGLEISNSSSNVVYNNLIYNNATGPSQSYDLIQQDTANANKFYNNTIYQSGSGYRMTVYIKTGTNTELKNNIIVRSGSGQAIQLDVNPSVCDNNCFYKVGGGDPIYIDGTNHAVAYLNGKSWAHNNINENPAWDSNYKLTSGSSLGTGHVRDGGLDLSTAFTKDMIGVSRPQGPAWDMGAYEFSGELGLSVPKNLRIILD